jgi:carbonic anhydrase
MRGGVPVDGPGHRATGPRSPVIGSTADRSMPKGTEGLETSSFPRSGPPPIMGGLTALGPWAAPHPEFAMTKSVTDQLLENNRRYADGHAVHQPVHPGKQPIQPSRRVAVVGCMDARLDVEDLLGLQTGEAHIIRNAGGVVTEDAIRCLIISHHLLNTNEIILVHHTRCGMLAFTDDLLKAGLEGDPAAVKLLGQATGREFVCAGVGSSSPAAFHAFRGALEPLDAPRDAKNTERLEWDVRRGISTIVNHPWIPTSGPDAVTVRGFIYDVDTGKLDEVKYPGPMGSFG